jgi:hypothetical protein
MTEIILSVLLSIVSGFGVFLWRRQASTAEQARRLVEEWRGVAEEANEEREKLVAENVDTVVTKIEAIGDSRSDREKLAEMINRG